MLHLLGTPKLAFLFLRFGLRKYFDNSSPENFSLIKNFDFSIWGQQRFKNCTFFGF